MKEGKTLLHWACRTAICKAKRGGFKDTLADDLLAPVLKVRCFWFLYSVVFEIRFAVPPMLILNAGFDR